MIDFEDFGVRKVSNFGNFRANLGEKLFSGCTTMVDFGFHKHRGFIHQFILIFKSIEKELSKC